MISYIKGDLRTLNSEDSQIVIVAGGVGYTVLLPFFVLRSLVDRGKKEGDEIELEIYYHLSERQPRPVLVGFNNEFERRFFEKLIGVEALGPSKAAKAFVFSVSTVAGAIEDGDLKTLESMPGIGSRMAQKMVATLQGKVAEFALLKDEGYSSIPTATVDHTKDDLRDEAIEVLSRLGEKKADAKLKVEEALQRNPKVKDTEELLREVLRKERG